MASGITKPAYDLSFAKYLRVRYQDYRVMAVIAVGAVAAGGLKGNAERLQTMGTAQRCAVNHVSGEASALGLREGSAKAQSAPNPKPDGS